ncbi:membrane protease YdiL (CAAX protease family) [Clostridium saccharoperbutylacetonicum]|uniref:Abortive infection protein n=1 Tax=Clostridium saccharoperbutylacetonicum N1-4(HMT) TaxID=931276 RepID=M1MMA2_9CLOT|nr:CPBP family intramembrane glutamic endopeptidase [Clostridium saccharoperbutylacetonicum]AGF57348.1 abortive infection protein [Clostridium saccharoperbutylacetonicum N1-4(HMT)]NRT61890.1 membrane protease YdiL (CAAX protease family) [Clostridium saccharoperbutylacetonicum]NSB25216.1 membrane protease YdiL (CAAX protease family) [Clostridium saccharoperbutylacetonicum]NSB44588.1 membrane protease YdiL (CAAX protease family) [Clostridium saccharoperbutylacetonicum]
MKYERIFLSIILPITYFISILFWFKGSNSLLLAITALPAFAAIVSMLIENKSLKNLLTPFFQRISVKSLAFTIFFPITAVLFCMLVTIFTHQGSLLTSWNNIFLKIVSITLISIVLFIVGLLEEFGWRGYLLPRLIEKYKIKRATFIIGVIITLYHLPVIFILNFHHGLSKAIVYTLLQSAAVFAINFGFTYLFTLSKNVILPSIMLTLWNNLNLAILGSSYKLLPVQGYIIGNPYIVNGLGIFGLIYFIFFAIYAYKKFSILDKHM